MKEQAIGYCRISDQDQSRNSLHDQQIEITEYCQKNNIELAEVFIENGKSAFTFNRPEWKKLEQYLRKNRKVKYLIVKHIDRFSRATLLDALMKLNEIEDKLGVKILSISDDIKQNNKDLGVQLMRTINLLFSNNERNRIQQRSIDGQYRAKTMGRYVSLAPYGYVNARDENNQPILKIDPQKANNVKLVFKLFNEGVNMFEIRKHLKGFTQKNRSAIRDILERSIYAGIIEIPEHNGKPATQIQGIHEPIITQLAYYTAQMKLKGKHNTHQPAEDVFLRGWVTCSECGKKMTAGRSKGGTGKMYWYYKCETHRKNFSATKAHKSLSELLKNISLSEDSIQFIEKKLKESIEEHQKSKGGIVMRTKMQLAKVTEKIEQTQTRYLLNPDIDPSVYSKAMTELKMEKSDLEERLMKASQNVHDLNKKMKSLLPLLSSLDKAFERFNLYQKQLFLKVALSEVCSWDGKVWTTNYLNPLFADNYVKIKDLGLLKMPKAPDKSAFGLLSTGEQTVGQLLSEYNLFVLIA